MPPGSLAVPSGEKLEIPSEIVQHLKVLRLGIGHQLELTDGEGKVALGALVELRKRSAEVLVQQVKTVSEPPGPYIQLLQGVGKGDKLDSVTRQVAELGVRRLVPVLSERSVATRENRSHRLRAIVDDAVRVSGRAHRMEVDSPKSLGEALNIEADLRVVLALSPECSVRDIFEGQPVPRRLSLLVGPEGGFSDEEIQLAQDAGFMSANMGPHTFRTETAGPAVVAMAQYAYLK